MTFQRALGDESEAGPEETGGAQSRPALGAEGPFRSLPGGGARVQVPTVRVRRRRGWGTRGTEAAPPAPPDAPRQPQGQCSRRTLRNRLHLHDVPSRTRAVYRAPFPLPVAGSALTPRVNSMSWRGDDEDGPHGGLLPLLTIHPWAKEPHLRCPSPARASGGRTSPEPPPRWRGCSGRCPRGSRPRAPGRPPPCDPRASS